MLLAPPPQAKFSFDPLKLAMLSFPAPSEFPVPPPPPPPPPPPLFSWSIELASLGDELDALDEELELDEFMLFKVMRAVGRRFEAEEVDTVV